MEKMIGYCGYNCHLCAARSDDPAVRQKLLDGWKKYSVIRCIVQKMSALMAAKARDD